MCYTCQQPTVIKQPELKHFSYYCETCESDLQKCTHCGEYAIQYHDELDAKFCGKCDEWMESACDSPTCHFCAERPEKPSETHYVRQLRGIQ